MAKTNPTKTEETPSLKKKFLNYGLQVVRELLNMKETEPVSGKVTLNDINLEDVQKGKIRLERKESMILDDLKKVEAEKRRLFEQGVKNAGLREQKVLARKIKELETQSKNYDRMLQAISVQERIIGNFIQIKEQERMNKEMGLESIFGEIDVEDLILYMEDAMVDGELSMRKMTDLASSLDRHNIMSDAFTEDEDVMDIVKLMQEAQSNPEKIDNSFEKITKIKEEKSKQEASEEDDLYDDSLEDL